MSSVHSARCARAARCVLFLFALLPLLLLASCDQTTTEPDARMAELPFYADVAEMPIATIVVKVSAADIPTQLVFNFTVVDGIASGTIFVPPGPDRWIEATAFASTGEVTHRGGAYRTLTPGANPLIQIVMMPVIASIPIEVVLGTYSVTIVPATVPTLAPAETFQLSVEIRNSVGAVTGSSAFWATTNPAVATVDAMGLVTAVSPGDVYISATFNGLQDRRLVTVASP